ncbi:MarR family winged helix-turn-helix transcriptional regulator [Nocardia alba]|uniref:DNA-binding MarR family transcriptional regulator n=1 Tax=Nocardia alba TaxID=225051 RepID=A0A4R1FXH7_9NOCA|nr:MarR family transcriptional regulator [Nocardia alba]TCK00327.1 DNA-binding MarR family transcriptional regulator [Nocardia alba]
MPNEQPSRRPAIAAWAALLQVHAALVPELDAELRRATGLPLTWYDVLLELDGTGPMRMSDLSEKVVLSRTRVSRLVAELESNGLLRRDTNPDDGRSALVAITDLGRQRFREAAPRYLDDIERRFGANLEPDELEALAATLRKVLGPTPVTVTGAG